MLYATTIALIVTIIVVAIAITYHSGDESVTFPVTGNIAPPYNQAQIVLQYKGDWIGGYSFQKSNGEEYFAKVLNGTGGMQLLVDRPNNTAPWIMMVLIQGSPRVQGNLTLSVFLPNRTLIDKVTEDSYFPSLHLVTMTVNMENLTSTHSPK